jgi:putative tricarboxylic transport membrane protein
VSRYVVNEFVGAAVLVLVGLGFAVGGAGYGVFNEEGRIGTGFLPFVSGLLMAVFGLAVAVETWLGARRAAFAADGTDGREGDDLLALALASDDEHPVAGEVEGQGRSVALVFALTLGAILLIPFIGFLISFALLLFVLVTWVEREGVARGLAISVAGVVFTYLIFEAFLKVPLPGGYPGLWLGY